MLINKKKKSGYIFYFKAPAFIFQSYVSDV